MEKQMCEASVWNSGGFGGRYEPCEYAGKVERDGKWFCGIHDPVKKAEKDKVRQEKYDAAYQASQRRYRLHAAAPDLLAALQELVARCDGEEGIRKDGSNIQTMQAHAAIAKAEGQS